MKKKFLSIVMALLIVPCIVMLAGCGNVKDVEGKYNIESITITQDGTKNTLTKDNIDAEIAKPENSEALTQSMLNMYKSIFDTATFEIKTGGAFETKVTLTFMGTPQQQTLTGTWKVSGNKITFTMPNTEDPTAGDKVVEGTVKNGKISVKGAESVGANAVIVLTKVK